MARKARNQESQPMQDSSVELRTIKALRLRALGYTYAEIAHEVGWANESSAYRAIKKALGRTIRDEARALVNLQLDRIDFALMNAVMPKVQKGDLWAVDRLVTLLKRQAELLGLDAVAEAPELRQNYTKTIHLVRKQPDVSSAG